MQFYLPGDETAWEAWEVDENGKEIKMDTEARKQASIQDSKEQLKDTMTTTGTLPMFPSMTSWIIKISSSGFRIFRIRKNWNGVHFGVQFIQKMREVTAWNQISVSVRCHPE